MVHEEETIGAIRRVLRTNYNVSDAVASSDQLLLRARIDWQGRKLGFEGSLYKFDAERNWANAEGFIFNQSTEQIDRPSHQTACELHRVLR